MDREPLYKTKEEVLKKAKSANGHYIFEYNVNNRKIDNNKGVIGQIIEEGLFGYSINNRAEPDFEQLGIELKVTAVKALENKNYVAKERLVLNLIDYYVEGETDFEHSSFWNKNKNLLVMFYLYEEGMPLDQCQIVDSVLYKYPAEDLKIIKDDWEKINNRINKGEAHLISEADTMYLAACTKGENGQALRFQPHSDIKAKQRAFCLKPSYLNRIIHLHDINKAAEKLANFESLKDKTFEVAINSAFSKYKGMSESALKKEFGIESSSKNCFETISSKILNLKGKMNKSEEFLKGNVVAKTIRVEEKGTIKESMSFPNFEFVKLANETWEDSELREIFYGTKFLFIVYKKHGDEYCFDRVKFWNMPVDILDTKVKEVWEKTKEVILSGNIVDNVYVGNDGLTKNKTNFPGLGFNGVCHVRPHAKNAEDAYLLPKPDNLTGMVKYTKQCFWLNASFIKSIIEEKWI